MSVIYSVNGTTFHGVVSNWTAETVGRNYNNVVRYSPLMTNTWALSVMSKTDFLLLQAMQEETITELKTTTYGTRNSQATYTDVIQMGAVNGTARGHRVENVSVTFRVEI